MSITVRLWSDEDLAKVGKDRKLTTIFLNGKTFSAEEIKHYPYGQRQSYLAVFDGEVVDFYATDDEMAVWFFQQEYSELPLTLLRVITTFRKVELPTK